MEFPGAVAFGVEQPQFWLMQGEPASGRPRAHVAFHAATRLEVDTFHRAALDAGAFLSFIGLGVHPPTPSWGSMISDGSQSIRTYPNQALFPAFALAFTMFAFNFLGDGLRDAFAPRLRGKQ